MGVVQQKPKKTVCGKRHPLKGGGVRMGRGQDARKRRFEKESLDLVTSARGKRHDLDHGMGGCGMSSNGQDRGEP